MHIFHLFNVYITVCYTCNFFRTRNCVADCTGL